MPWFLATPGLSPVLPVVSLEGDLDLANTVRQHIALVHAVLRSYAIPHDHEYGVSRDVQLLQQEHVRAQPGGCLPQPCTP